MSLPMICNLLQKAQQDQSMRDILLMNNATSKYGLLLTIEEVRQILRERDRCLQHVGRVELSSTVFKLIIGNFSDSAFITPQEYSTVLSELHEIFYYMKNETEDKIGDEKLIRIMKDYFENTCGGSLEMLKDKMQQFAENFRKEIPIR